MKINFQKFPLFISVIFLIFSCFIFYFLYNKVQENRVISEKLNIKTQEETAYLEELRSLAHGLKIIEKEKVEFEKHFAEKSNLVPFLDTIEELAPKVGATTEILTIDISPDNLNLLVSLEAKGNFPSLYKLLTLLENAPYELKITSFNILKEPDVAWKLKATLKLISFVN